MVRSAGPDLDTSLEMVGCWFDAGLDRQPLEGRRGQIRDKPRF